MPGQRHEDGVLALPRVVQDGFACLLRVAEHPEKIVAQLKRFPERQNDQVAKELKSGAVDAVIVWDTEEEHPAVWDGMAAGRSNSGGGFRRRARCGRRSRTRQTTRPDSPSP
ncbi:hypothetical protein GCM10010272_13260 [Streptomyces lateritius]|nr:hypothetical protein GCM10010272_13260 [Streptomyces lateritius]